MKRHGAIVATYGGSGQYTYQLAKGLAGNYLKLESFVLWLWWSKDASDQGSQY